MATTKKRSAGKRSRARATRRRVERSRICYEVLGVALIALGVMTLVSLFWKPSAGVIGRNITGSLALVFGVGAFGVPVALCVLGVWAIGRFTETRSRNSLVGIGLLFVSVVSWYHLAATQPGKELFDAATRWQALMKPDGASPWSDGGLVGAFLANLLRRYLGVLSYVLLSALALVGVLLVTDIGLADSIQWLREEWSAAFGNFEPRVPQAESKNGKNGKRDTGKMIDAALKPEPPKPEPREDKPSPLRRLLDVFDHPQEEKPAEPAPTPAPVVEEARITTNPMPVVRKTPKKPAPSEDQMEMDVEEPESEFVLPPTSLLDPPSGPPKRTREELETNIRTIEQTLDQFKITANVVEFAHGPTVTRYEIQLAPGIKVSKIVSLADNLALSLAAIDVRVEAPIPGKSAIGIEVPNRTPAVVSLRECVEAPEFQSGSKISFTLGRDVANTVRTADLTKMPHLLIGGATNSGKSICLNTLIGSILFRATPDEVKFILIDPKRVELSLFDGIPHLIHPVVKDVRQAAGILRWTLKEMERRYDLFAKAVVRNIDGYNSKLPPGEKPMPFIVVVVDELADLMMQQGPEVEVAICRLAQLARATGIHLVIATQRPSVDVVTGTIKANISSRIAFAVASGVDSRTILDGTGAERLIGRGDMLFQPIDAQKPIRIQGAYMSEKEIERLVSYLKGQAKPDYIAEAITVDSAATGGGTGAAGDSGNAEDELFEPAVRWVVTNQRATTSALQRKFNIGYTRAARLVDMMEERGFVGPLDGVKPREILINRMDLDTLFLPGGIRRIEEPEDDEPEGGEYEETP